LLTEGKVVNALLPHTSADVTYVGDVTAVGRTDRSWTTACDIGGGAGMHTSAVVVGLTPAAATAWRPTMFDVR
jgi:hypothetical protein